MLSLLNIHRPVLFETALRDADTTLLRTLREKIETLDPRRRKLLEAELSRRKSAMQISLLGIVVALLAFSSVVLLW